jgi:AmmeMemoRadiSam system protein B/AmmeMemoRadiSam system protein A
MAERNKNRVVVAALVGLTIVVTVGLVVRFHGSFRSAAEPAEPPADRTDSQVEIPPPDEEKPVTQPPVVVLRSSLAGSWYPDNAEVLKAQFKRFFDEANTAPQEDLIALILPHAGYRYSGRTAVAGLKAISKRYARIIVIGPSHRVPMEEVLSVPLVTHYETPLGRTPLDVEFISRLLRYPVFQNVPHAHRHEHSAQIELPLLQFRIPDFRLVPIVAGDCSLETIRNAAAILKSMVDEQTLVVISSDFVHYGTSYGYVPFTENISEQIRNLDMGAFTFIETLDGQGFVDYRHRTGATICGHIPIALLLSMLDESSSVRLVEYTTSGQIEGDHSRSVSYLSIAFAGAWQKRPSAGPTAHNVEMEDSDREQLIGLAREAIGYVLEHRQVPDMSELGFVANDTLKRPRGTFVTLKKGGNLRGCIGDIFPCRPLYKSVFSNALNAAFADRRFPSLRKHELNDIRVEISVLTRPRPVSSYHDIRIGTDGVVLSKNGRSAVFLPQVAREQGWNLDRTLTQLALKAGLEADDWRQGASFLVFQADVFGESEQ